MLTNGTLLLLFQYGSTVKMKKAFIPFPQTHFCRLALPIAVLPFTDTTYIILLCYLLKLKSSHDITNILIQNVRKY